MEHTSIVRAEDLSRYADTRDSEAVIPELLYQLIRQSVPDAAECRIPYGDNVNQPGLDGLVECKKGYFQFVPDGISYWEIGTGRNPQDKATADFKKRTKDWNGGDREESTFVFVTPRSAEAGGWDEPRQRAWIEKRKDCGWKKIRIIDGVKLADWLREFPALGQWMAKKLGITRDLGGMSTPLQHWQLIESLGESGDPPLPAKLFTVSRNAACDALEAVFTGESKRLFLFAESEHDVDDFVAAYLFTLEKEEAQEYANRCLFISDENAWRTVSQSRRSHILVASARLGLDSERQDLQTVATSRGHGVVIPLCGALSGESPEIVKLRSPSQSQIEAVLREARFSDVRARELGGIADGRISALRRHLHGLGSVPSYVKWDSARELSRACLTGQWNAKNPADIRAVELLLGKDYGEWIETLRVDALRSDSPLTQNDEKWRLVARGEAWSTLGNRITDEDLDRLETTAILVLGERDPQFDLPREDRFAASIHGKQLEHSQHLRKGLAETLALVGSQPQALSSCSYGKPEATAVIVVRTLLHEADWERWASLDPLLPLLAESAPDEFLDAVESVLVDLSTSPFHEVFAQEGGGIFGGSTYMSGLLWALEGLAWHPDYLSRVAVILADIASIDPGGNWANRPANSLASILLPWYPQTTASFDKRMAAIKTVLKEQPKVGWSLLLALLPHGHAVTNVCHRPVWRDFIPRDWKEGVLQNEYWRQITALTDLAVELAKEDSVRLVELIDRLSDLPETAHDPILSYLSSDSVVNLPECERFRVWAKLDGLVRRHKKFFDAKWVLPEKAIIKIEKTAELLAPYSPRFKYHHLFNNQDFDLYDEKGNYTDQQKRLELARQAAVSEILGKGGLPECLDFAASVALPYEVGLALGAVASSDVESAILPAFLDTSDDVEQRVIAGFVWARFTRLKIGWVDAILKRGWTPQHLAKFLTLLPFEVEMWERASTHLGKAYEELYWRNVRINPYGVEQNLGVAIEKLLMYGREGAAVMCIGCTVEDDATNFDEDLATRSLVAVLSSERGIQELDSYHTVELIKRLQKSQTVDQDALLQIEWNFLPWLDGLSSGSPVFLEKRLASNPVFFAEVVRLIFRSEGGQDNDTEELGEQGQHLAKNAYRLITRWSHCPGTLTDGSFDTTAFHDWIAKAREITEETGHTQVAQIQIGHVLTHAPSDPGGLWIHKDVATVLNQRDTSAMRSGFATEILNQRGVHWFSNGREERELAKLNREKAEALDAKGFARFATVMREVAERYDRQAALDEERDPFDNL